MTRCSLAVRTSNVTINNAAAELIAGLNGFRLWSVVFSVASAAASVFGVGRPAAAGITPTTPVTLLSNDGALAGAAGLSTAVALAWATSPTSPAAYFARISMPATIGNSPFVMKFPQGIYVRAGQTLVVQNITANGLADLTFDVTE